MKVDLGDNKLKIEADKDDVSALNHSCSLVAKWNDNGILKKLQLLNNDNDVIIEAVLSDFSDSELINSWAIPGYPIGILVFIISLSVLLRLQFKRRYNSLNVRN